jgi:hypothetical protein
VRTWRLGFAGAVGATPPAVERSAELAPAPPAEPLPPAETLVPACGGAPEETVPPTLAAIAAAAAKADIAIPSSAALTARNRNATSFVGLRG